MLSLREYPQPDPSWLLNVAGTCANGVALWRQTTRNDEDSDDNDEDITEYQCSLDDCKLLRPLLLLLLLLKLRAAGIVLPAQGDAAVLAKGAQKWRPVYWRKACPPSNNRNPAWGDGLRTPADDWLKTGPCC